MQKGGEMKTRWALVSAVLLLSAFTVFAQYTPCQVEVFFGDPISGAVLKPFLLKEIGEAEKSIYIAAHKLTDEELIGALAQAVERGVEVKVLLGESGEIRKQSCISWDEAANNVGKTLWVYGVVKSVARTSYGYVFINLGNPYPETPRFTIFIKDPSPFDSAFGPRFENKLKGKMVYVYGEISLYKGLPEIKASSPDQLKAEVLGTTLPECTEVAKEAPSQLIEAGVTVRYFKAEKGSFNQGFAVIDGQLVLTGSFDWTSDSLANDFVTLLIFDCSGMAGSFGAQFNYLWDNFSSEGK